MFLLFLEPIPLPVILVMPSVEGLDFALGISPSFFEPVPLEGTLLTIIDESVLNTDTDKVFRDRLSAS